MIVFEFQKIDMIWKKEKKREGEKTLIQQNTGNTIEEQFIKYIYIILYQATNGLLQSIC